MLKDEIKKNKSNKKKHKNRPKSILQTHDPSHEIEIFS
jgi:hypothetical protein